MDKNKIIVVSFFVIICLLFGFIGGSIGSYNGRKRAEIDILQEQLDGLKHKNGKRFSISGLIFGN